MPWTEEPGRLQSMGSQRVAYDLVTKAPLPMFKRTQKTPLSSSPSHLMLQWGPLPTAYSIPLELCLEVHGRDLGSLCEDLCSALKFLP